MNPFSLIGAKLVNAIGNAGDRLFTSTEEKLAARNQREKQIFEFRKEQLDRKAELNRAQVAANVAASNPGARRTFRDYAGFVAVVAFAFTTFIRIINEIAPWFNMPQLALTDSFHDTHEILVLLLGGVWGARTIEKIAGVARGQENGAAAGTASVAAARALIQRVRKT